MKSMKQFGIVSGAHEGKRSNSVVSGLQNRAVKRLRRLHGAKFVMRNKLFSDSDSPLAIRCLCNANPGLANSANRYCRFHTIKTRLRCINGFGNKFGRYARSCAIVDNNPFDAWRERSDAVPCRGLMVYPTQNNSAHFAAAINIANLSKAQKIGFASQDNNA